MCLVSCGITTAVLVSPPVADNCTGTYKWRHTGTWCCYSFYNWSISQLHSPANLPLSPTKSSCPNTYQIVLSKRHQLHWSWLGPLSLPSFLYHCTSTGEEETCNQSNQECHCSVVCLPVLVGCLLRFTRSKLFIRVHIVGPAGYGTGQFGSLYHARS